MAEDPKQNQDSASGFGSPLALFKRLTSQTVASSFQTQSRDQFGAMVYNRSNATIANLSTLLGSNAVASGNRSTAVGAFANAREDSAAAYGIYSRAWGASSLSFGDQSLASAYRSVSIGPLTNVTGIRAVGIGAATSITAQDGVGIGTSVKVTGPTSVSIGNNSFVTATSGLGVAVGNGAQVSGTQGGICVGNGTTTAGTDCIAIGAGATATGPSYGIAVGSGASSGNSNAVAIGRAASTNSANTIVIGDSTVNLDGYIYGDWRLPQLGKGVYLKEGTNATYGRVTLSGAGTAIIYSTKISATSQILLTPQNASGTAGAVYISTSTSGVRATVASTVAADTRTVGWLLLESA